MLAEQVKAPPLKSELSPRIGHLASEPKLSRDVYGVIHMMLTQMCVSWAQISISNQIKMSMCLNGAVQVRPNLVSPGYLTHKSEEAFPVTRKTKIYSALEPKKIVQLFGFMRGRDKLSSREVTKRGYQSNMNSSDWFERANFVGSNQK